MAATQQGVGIAGSLGANRGGQMLKSLSFVAAAALCALGAFSGSSGAAALVHNNDNQRSFAPTGDTKAYSTKAAVAYYYTRGERDRSKNVSAFTNPAAGEYCITPSIALNFSKIYPHVTVEYEASAGAALSAFWANESSDCPEGSLTVLTFDDSGNPSSAVAFDFTVE
jgi:hypothetical protein